ncbi:4Fe-4S dicluster domain-containing protein [Litorilinea aerophila]|uniref:4Fe-4S dicluster domain-containing protein n=1 Tax=Litorilinea aerophila TaxID=1204385 RepID=A0A540VMF8_9CHLR|nr:4Fe-4S dicluster domain-containing protein [Litorilinea aerophila]MCC9075001.1 4Fe-4S dicluster domain-containing protein [Litorilinea aerophila]OUC07866.1 nitrate oxidoreductase subunit beta [Litorilinea aerophila]
MPDVYNWQIGRTMTYPYPEAHPNRQFVAVFNINRCIGCQTCTGACKATWTFSRGQEYMWWNNVETKPYGSYPQHWDVKALKLLDEAHQAAGVRPNWDRTQANAKAPYGVYNGLTLTEAAGPNEVVLGYLPTEAEWRSPNFYEDTSTAYKGGPFGLSPNGAALPEHQAWFFYLMRICNHCTYPACLAACPRKAIYKREEDGIVLIDQERCRGYRKCVEACPYKKSMYRGTTQVSEKCVGCYPRVEGSDPLSDGVPMETRCMAVCPGKIRLNGLVEVAEDGSWVETPHHPLYYLVRIAQVALPLYPQFGTEPNIYYIPPRWAPRAYLRQMFGPGVDQAIERYIAPSRELLAVLQLFRTTQKMIFRFEIEEGPLVREVEVNGKAWQMYNDTVIGFDAKGREAVRLSVVEPLYERPAERLNSI